MKRILNFLGMFCVISVTAISVAEHTHTHTHKPRMTCWFIEWDIAAVSRQKREFSHAQITPRGLA